jgi:phage terminase small subunit
MSLRKSPKQKFSEGRNIGVHKLDKMLAAEPVCESGLLPPPPHLRGDAKLIYLHYAEQLLIMNMDKRPDRFALALVSTALARVWKCDERLNHDGIVSKVAIREGRGARRKTVGYRSRKSPWWSIRVDLVKEFDRLATPFGLTGPSSRVSLQGEGSRSTVPSLAERNAKLWHLLNQPRPARPLLPEQVAFQASQRKAAEEKKTEPAKPDPVQ